MKKEERKREEKEAEKKGWRGIFQTIVIKKVPSKISVTYSIHTQRKINSMLLRAKEPYHSTSSRKYKKI